MSCKMANSGNIINYSIRAAKNIERKMLRDIFVRLSPVGVFSDYQYIGFGSKYFVDFIMFHRYLNIQDMTSIESDTRFKEKYVFNKPYDCVKLEFGHSNEVLPKLNLTKKSIVWLDYDSAFSKTMLTDLSTLVERLPSGSIITLSYNSEPYREKELVQHFGRNVDKLYRRKFEEVFGKQFIPGGFDERGWTNKIKFSKFIRQVIISQIESVLSKRNISILDKDKFKLQQVAYFDYADGARMSTLSFVIFNSSEQARIENCRANELFFYKDSDCSYEIKVPNLTNKEIRYLMEKMPGDNNLIFDKKIFNQEEVLEFKKNYKYYPSFFEIDSI